MTVHWQALKSGDDPCHPLALKPMSCSHQLSRPLCCQSASLGTVQLAPCRAIPLSYPRAIPASASVPAGLCLPRPGLSLFLAECHVPSATSSPFFSSLLRAAWPLTILTIPLQLDAICRLGTCALHPFLEATEVDIMHRMGSISGAFFFNFFINYLNEGPEGILNFQVTLNREETLTPSKLEEPCREILTS